MTKFRNSHSIVCGGVDLAAQSANTGLALIRSNALTGELVIEKAQLGATDEDIVAAALSVTKLGVDVPLGWPAKFVSHLVGHQEQNLPMIISSDQAWRRTMVMRHTDEVVRGRIGLVPLSVAADRIAYPALRWSAIETSLRLQTVDCSRDGSGQIAEVYPAAALKIWGLPFRGYKSSGSEEVRTLILAGLENRFPGLDWNGHRDIIVSNDDVLDAVISALIARQVALEQTYRPTENDLKYALTEGWIHLPEDLLENPEVL